MKITKKDRIDFEERKLVLKSAKNYVKNEFVGLDNIIDEIFDLMEPWYLFPGGQLKPTIINLFGMTGVGKTSLIKRIFYHINLEDSLYKFDVGDYASQDNTKLSYSFSENLKNREGHQIGLIFDEFQLGRTIDEKNNELEKSGLRAMWDLLDSGKISILQSSYYGSKIFQLTMKLEECVDEGNVESENGIIVKGKKYHEKIFKTEALPKLEGSTKKEELAAALAKEDLFVPEEFYWYIQSIWETRFITNREIKEYLKTMGHKDAIAFLNDTQMRAFKPVEYDYSSSCIFVIGNIDEAYQMTKNISPDTDADRFYKHSLKITLPRIKEALQKRFRSEQIARLGNSYIIYPAFSSKVYKELISLELVKLKNKVKETFDVSLEFDKTVNTIIYKEGVFPTQGARPVFTTITALVDAYVGKLIKDILESGKEINVITWKFTRNKYEIKFLDKNKDIVMTKLYPVKLKVESLRRSDKSEMQAHVAIHEAGHAIAAIYGANLLPTEIVSRTANLSEGHCSIDLPSIDTKELLEKEIIISLGGYVAEKIVFGEENLSNGTGGDFQRATSTALRMAKSYGMSGLPMLIGHKDVGINELWNSEKVDAMDKLAEKIVKSCEEKCVKLIEDNKYLLLKIGEYLATHSRMDSKKIRSFLEEFGKEVELKDKNKYHSFKERIAKGVREQEENSGPLKSITQRYGAKLKTNSQTNAAFVVESKKNKDD